MSKGEKPRPCDRCGVMKKGRLDTLCPDCRATLSAEENIIWKTQMVESLANIRRLAA